VERRQCHLPQNKTTIRGPKNGWLNVGKLGLLRLGIRRKKNEMFKGITFNYIRADRGPKKRNWCRLFEGKKTGEVGEAGTLRKKFFRGTSCRRKKHGVKKQIKRRYNN